jgi:hypothetical protein
VYFSAIFGRKMLVVTSITVDPSVDRPWITFKKGTALEVDADDVLSDEALVADCSSSSFND